MTGCREAGGRTRPCGQARAPRAQDYLVAQGSTRAAVLDGRVQGDRRVCFTQDGVDWLDLPEVPTAAARAAANGPPGAPGTPAMPSRCASTSTVAAPERLARSRPRMEPTAASGEGCCAASRTASCTPSTSCTPTGW